MTNSPWRTTSASTCSSHLPAAPRRSSTPTTVMFSESIAGTGVHSEGPGAVVRLSRLDHFGNTMGLGGLSRAASILTAGNNLNQGNFGAPGRLPATAPQSHSLCWRRQERFLHAGAPHQSGAPLRCCNVARASLIAAAVVVATGGVTRILDDPGSKAIVASLARTLKRAVRDQRHRRALRLRLRPSSTTLPEAFRIGQHFRRKRPCTRPWACLSERKVESVRVGKR